MTNSNRKIINLNKVQYVWLYYENQEGDKVQTKPQWSTVRGIRMQDSEYAYPYITSYPFETNLECAKRLDILDEWTPVCKVQLSKHHQLKYTGKKSISNQ